MMFYALDGNSLKTPFLNFWAILKNLSDFRKTLETLHFRLALDGKSSRENTRSDFRDDMFFGELCFTCKNVSFHTKTQSSNESRSEELLFHDGLVYTVTLLKMIFQSVLRSLSTLMFMDIIGSHSLRTTYAIFEAFQTLFPTALSIFTMAKLFYQVI